MKKVLLSAAMATAFFGMTAAHAADTTVGGGRLISSVKLPMYPVLFPLTAGQRCERLPVSGNPD